MSTKQDGSEINTKPAGKVIQGSLNRLLNLQNTGPKNSALTENEKRQTMITNVTAKPNPFSTVITLDVICEQSRHVIVRMFEEDGKIVKMFSWYLVRGTNVTAINDLRNIGSGAYVLDIIDHEGTVLFSTRVTKN